MPVSVKMSNASEIVNLNVGGIHYVTLYSTIMQSPKLASIVHQNKDQQEIFIDRTGSIFGYVLEYLRNGDKVVLPSDAMALRKLVQEANFYGLDGLAKVIQANSNLGSKFGKDDYVKFQIVPDGHNRWTKEKSIADQCIEYSHVNGSAADLIDTIKEMDSKCSLDQWIGTVLVVDKKSYIVKFTAHAAFEKQVQTILRVPEVMLKRA